MNVDEAIKMVRDKSKLRTRYEGQEPFLDEVLVAEIERLTTENRTHVATIGCLIEQAKSAAVAHQAEVERLRAALDLSEEYNEQKDAEIDGLRAGIAAIAEQLNCEQKAGTICSCIRALQRELNRISGEYAKATSATIPDLQDEIERLRNAIKWLHTRMECIRSDRAIYAHILREDFEQFKAMVDGEGNG